MKGGGKRKSNSEAPNDSAAADVNVSNGENGPSAPVDENNQTQLQKGEEEETQVQDSEEEAAEGGDGAEEEEREDGDRAPQEGQGPKLDDGFYEVEAIRRRRVRKGQLQYLIKWRGWPETANTWEPLENLQSVPDIIHAFEESLRSGKRRKRKRKHAVHHTQPKKRLERSTTCYSLRRFATNVSNSHPQSAPVNDITLADLPALPQTVIFADEGEINGDATSPGKAKQVNENGYAIVSKQLVERREENEYDPKLSELKVTTSSMTTNGVDANKLAIHFQEANTLMGNGYIDIQSKVDCMEPVQSGRCRGAKRRKSGSVKRFKKDTYVCETIDAQKAISMSGGTVVQAWTEIADIACNNGHKRMDDARAACNIVKIIKPVGYSASVSSNMQDVSVTFTAMRSDGTEVRVDNKFLKANDPLLLINFYEQHLRYCPTS